MKKLKNKKIEIPIDLLEGKVTIVFTRDIQKYVDKYPDLFEKRDVTMYMAFCYNKGGESYCLLPNEASVSVVCHEVSHAVDNMMACRGLTDGEVRAIIFEYIIQKIYE